MDKKKRWFLIVVLLIVFMVFVLQFSFYKSRFNTNTTFSSSYPMLQEYFPENPPVIGVFIKGDMNNKLKEKMASYLKEYFSKFGCDNVFLLQYEENDRPIDLLINARFDSKVSWLPFYKRSKINFSFTSESLACYPERLSDSIVDFDSSGTSKGVFMGLISNRKAHEVLMKNVVKKYLDSIHNHKYLQRFLQLNKPVENKSSWKFDFNLDLSFFNKKPDSNISIPEKYKGLIPGYARDVFSYYVKKHGDQVVINYKTNKPPEEITDYYSRLLKEIKYVQEEDRKAKWVEQNNAIYLGYDGYHSEDYRLKIIIDNEKIKDQTRFSEDTKEDQELKTKNVQIVFWSFDPQIRALNRMQYNYYWYSYEITDIEKILKNKKLKRDFFYYLSKIKLKQMFLEKKYWSTGDFPSSMEEEIIKYINKLSDYHQYEDAYHYYKGDYYLLKANLLHSVQDLKKAKREFQKINTIKKKGFSSGANSKLLQIQVLPYSENPDYKKVLKKIKREDIDTTLLRDYELLMKSGNYQQALEELQYADYSGKPIKVILKAVIGDKDNGFELLKEDNNDSPRLTRKLSKVYVYYLRDNYEMAKKLLDNLKDEFPEWIIKSKANDLYLRTGIKLPETILKK